MATVSGFVFSTSSVPSGPRRSFLSIIDELARPIDAADSTVRALAADAFREAVRRMNLRGNWPWEILEEDVSITANQKFSTVQSAIKQPLAMHLLTASGGTRDEKLSYVSYDRFMERYSMNFTGNPQTYTIPNLFEVGRVQWHPIPGANDNARFTYYRMTPLPKLESDNVEIPEGHALGAYMAIAWYEFFKRIPAAQRPFPITIAKSDANEAYRAVSTMASTSGDVDRIINPSAYGAY